MPRNCSINLVDITKNTVSPAIASQYQNHATTGQNENRCATSRAKIVQQKRPRLQRTAKKRTKEVVKSKDKDEDSAKKEAVELKGKEQNEAQKVAVLISGMNSDKVQESAKQIRHSLQRAAKKRRREEIDQNDKEDANNAIKLEKKTNKSIYCTAAVKRELKLYQHESLFNDGVLVFTQMRGHRP